MVNKLKVCSIFTNMENVHLIKDPGMIPLYLFKTGNYDVELCLPSNGQFEYIHKYFKDLNIVTMKYSVSDSFFYKQWIKDKYIIKNASNIDVLQLFAFQITTFIDVFLYKLFNPNGFVYVHCDTDGSNIYDNRRIIEKIKVLIRRILLHRSISDILWGVQNRTIISKLKNHWEFENVSYIPDGFFLGDSTNEIDKKNIILTVGRIGSSEKRTDLLLEGFANAYSHLEDWYLYLVGPIENSFHSYIDDFFKKYPFLTNNIKFIGSITNRNELKKYYQESKVFALTSSNESFGIVMVEALSEGCAIIASDIPSAREIIKNDRLGNLFTNGDVLDFSRKLYNVCNNELLVDNIEYRKEYANSKYSWESIIKELDDWIMLKTNYDR